MGKRVGVPFPKNFLQKKGWEGGKYTGQNFVIPTLYINKCSSEGVGAGVVFRKRNKLLKFFNTLKNIQKI